MEPSSQVILRNEASLGQGPVLLVNPPRDHLFRQLLSQARPVKVSTQYFGDFRWLTACGANASFDVSPAPDDDIKTIVLFLPREKDRLVMMLHALSCRMPDNAVLWLIGENNAGIKSAPRYLKRFFGQVNKLDNARHCALFEAQAAKNETSFEIAGYIDRWPLVVSEHEVVVASLPGVFAHGRLDKGSSLLLESLSRLQPAGSILDFACGSGVLACALMAGQTDVELTLLDVSALAIESSRLTLRENKMEATLLPSDGLAELQGQFDWIISNPPFHQGVRHDLDTAADFFQAAGTFLTDSGRIVIVCNRHLPYKRWLQDCFKEVICLDENNEFLVIQATQPKNR